MALGTYVPPKTGVAGSFDPRYNADKPLIVVVREFREDFTTRKFPNPKDVVIVDVVDILANTVIVSVIWGAGAVVDRLKDRAPADGADPEKLPVKLVAVKSQSTGNDYASIEPLEGKELELAVAWDAKNPTRIDDERAQRQSEIKEGPAEGQKAAPAEEPAAPADPKLSDSELDAAIAALG